MEIRDELRDILDRTDYTIHSIIRQVSQSGMKRAISFYVIIDNKLLMIDGHIHDILGYGFDKKNGGLIVKGCGMDMAFSVVYNLSCALYCPLKYDHDSAYKLRSRII